MKDDHIGPIDGKCYLGLNFSDEQMAVVAKAVGEVRPIQSGAYSVESAVTMICKAFDPAAVEALKEALKIGLYGAQSAMEVIESNEPLSYKDKSAMGHLSFAISEMKKVAAALAGVEP